MEAQLPLAKRPTLLLPMSIAPVAANATAPNRQVISWHQSLFPTGSVQLPRLAGAVAMLGSSSRNGCSAPFAWKLPRRAGAVGRFPWEIAIGATKSLGGSWRSRLRRQGQWTWATARSDVLPRGVALPLGLC